MKVSPTSNFALVTALTALTFFAVTAALRCTSNQYRGDNAIHVQAATPNQRLTTLKLQPSAPVRSPSPWQRYALDPDEMMTS